ncbi:MAG: hypothetical protein PHC41_05075 [Lachnospiraceae bacterium]|nr:hypothetical protein [Lachnospiraceae bacterium]MDD3615581.1 hypothetical protein [Lachnospiraceae bacterium]
MSGKTRIVVLHMKEILYTVIFLVLAVIMGILLFLMFGSRREDSALSASPDRFTPGKYTTTIQLNDNTFDVEVAVDADHINSIRLQNLSESTLAMYPLMEPALNGLATQIYASQSTEGITYSDESKYTSLLLLDAIDDALGRAEIK